MASAKSASTSVVLASRISRGGGGGGLVAAVRAQHAAAASDEPAAAPAPAPLLLESALQVPAVRVASPLAVPSLAAAPSLSGAVVAGGAMGAPRANLHAALAATAPHGHIMRRNRESRSERGSARTIRGRSSSAHAERATYSCLTKRVPFRRRRCR
eukprot:6214614-Pleurochrysis_carterae.AAC.3